MRAKSPADERGITLLVVMSLLMILTIIGVGAANVAFMERRMAHNYTRVIESDTQAMSDIIAAFRSVQRGVYGGPYNLEPFDPSNIPSFSIDGRTVSIRALKVQDLIDNAIMTQAEITSSQTFANPATTAHVYWGYHNNLDYATAQSITAKIEFFNQLSTVTRAARVPVLVMEATGDADSTYTKTVAWVALDPGPPIFSPVYAEGKVKFDNVGAATDFVKYYDLARERDCGGFLENDPNGVPAWISKSCEGGAAANCLASPVSNYNTNGLSSPLMNNVAPGIVDVAAWVTAFGTMVGGVIASNGTAIYPVELTASIQSRVGDSTDYKIFYRDGDLTINSDGFGLLVVNGKVVKTSNTIWRGTIIAKDKIEFKTSGYMVAGAVLSGGDVKFEDTGAIVLPGACNNQWAFGQLPPRILHIHRE